jgi:hypothetical protein
LFSTFSGQSATVGDSPRGPLKQAGESPLKTRNKLKTNVPHLSTRCMAHATMALNGPPRRPTQRSPRAGFASLEGTRLPRVGSAPFEGVRLPRAGSASLEGAPHACAYSRTRAFNALTTAGWRHHAPGARAPVPSHQLPRREPIPGTVGNCATWPAPVP